jgi:lambda family phage tail tape measure protein
MASSIRVVLEVDNKKYIADVKAAETATKKFGDSAETSTAQANRAFSKINGTTDMVAKKFSGLRSALAGLAFGALGRSALAMADQLQDLSNSSGIATARLLEFKKALTTSGGEADQMPQAISQFVRSIDEAAQGSLNAQHEFKSLGVSLKDLRTLSEQDLLKKTLEGLSKIEDPSRRAGAMMTMFGKSFKTVDPKELLDKLNATAGTADKYAESIKRAAQLNDDLATAQGNLKIAFLEAFSPILTKINEYNQKLTESGETMNGLITTIKIVGAALAAAFAASLILPVVTAIGTLGRSLGIVAGALGASSLAGWLASAFRVLGPLLAGFRALGLLIAAGVGIYTASQLFDNFGDIAVNALARIIESVGKLTGELLNLPTDAIAALFNIKNPMGLGDGLLNLVKNARQARDEAEKTQKANKARADFAANDPRRTDKQPAKTPGAVGRDVPDALEKQRKEIQSNIAEFQKYNAAQIDSINLDNMLIGKSAEYSEVIRAQEEIFKRSADKCDELRKAKALLGDKEKELGGEYDRQIKLISEAATVDAERLKRSIENSQGLKAIEADRIKGIERMTHALEEQQKRQEALSQARLSMVGEKQDVEFAGQQQGRSPFAQQAAEIVNTARKAALEAGRAYAAAFEDTGDGLTPARAQELAEGLEAIRQGYADIADAQQKNLDTSREWSQGWKEAFMAYSDNASNAAEQARTYFDTFSRGAEDALVNFVRTGKLSFKDLANSLIADFARIQAKKAIAGLFSMGGGGGGGGFSFGTLLSGFTGMFGGGRASGGAVEAGKSFLVGERGPEMFTPKGSGNIIPNNALGGGQTIQQITYNIQATDAASFKAQLARDPSFLHAVVEQGRRSTPSGARR